jgi:chromosome segregation ATPase
VAFAQPDSAEDAKAGREPTAKSAEPQAEWPWLSQSEPAFATHSPGTVIAKHDDGMMRAKREPMSIARLSAKVQRLDKSLNRLTVRVGRLEQSVDRGFKAVDRRFKGVDRRFEAVDGRFEAVDHRFDRIEHTIERSAEETRRHFEVIAESLRDDFRLFADAIARHSERLDQHDARLTRLERSL